MASTLLVSGCLLALLSAAPAVGPTAREAYVSRDQAPVRSGPGSEFYATDHLGRGTRLEVYRRDPGGWLAIRPPENSHSLVPLRQLRETKTAGVWQVADPQTVAWVATRHGPLANHKWQVQLEVGELVRVLGQDQFALVETGPRETVARIAPPAGEFRWIHEDFVADTPLLPTVEQAGPGAQAGPGGQVVAEGIELADYQLIVEGDDRLAAPPVSPAGFSEPAGSQPSQQQWRPARGKPAAGHAPVPAPTPIGTDTVPSATGKENSDPLDALPSATLQELDVILSLMVAQPPEQWDLAPLRAKLLEMVDQGESALERGRARLMLEKLTQFAELQERHRQVDRLAPRPGSEVAPAQATARIGV
ncbi:MAG: hypothetical protein J5I93_07670, partial [Pirellulaceae bacterium]|nr:hypothetical protein [Pirellulaceae bacterium]